MFEAPAAVGPTERCTNLYADLLNTQSDSWTSLRTEKADAQTAAQTGLEMCLRAINS